MGLQTDMEVYREPGTRMVALNKMPPMHSTDNGLLFSATYIVMLRSLKQLSSEESQWFDKLVQSCEIEPGLYRRYPGDLGLNAHDDLTGVAAVSPELALKIYKYGEAHDFSWNTENPGKWTWQSWLTRIVGFVPYVRSAAGLPVGYFGQIQIIASFLFNCFEGRQETNGKCLLYLRAKVLYGKYPLVDAGIDLWRARMAMIYPHGMREVYAIYFGITYPFALYGSSDFT